MDSDSLNEHLDVHENAETAASGSHREWSCTNDSASCKVSFLEFGRGDLSSRDIGGGNVHCTREDVQ